MDILTYSQQIQKTADEIVADSNLTQLWENIGADVYIVGSLNENKTVDT